MIKGEFDHALRMRQHLGDGKYGDAEFSLSVNVDGQLVFVEFKGCPSVRFPVSEMVSHAYEMLEKCGYMKNGKRTGKKYSIGDHIKKERKTG